MRPFLTAETVPQTIGVLLCTYRRPDDLMLCLDGLELQTRLPDEVMVIVRDGDRETDAALNQRAPGKLTIRRVVVHEPGLVASRNAALAAVQTDLVTFLDDDTVPRPEFVARVLEDFVSDPTIGALGGKDRCFFRGEFDDRETTLVGKIQWFGRTIGNHHIGVGPMRDVDMIKGANMSFRTCAIGETRFDRRLKGKGAQGNEDMCFSIAIRNKGWRCVYDPTAIVEHYVGRGKEARPYGLVESGADTMRFREFAYNEVVGVWDALTPLQRCAFFLWSVFVGTGVCPGLVQAMRYTRQLGYESWRRFGIAQQGKLDAFRDLLFA